MVHWRILGAGFPIDTGEDDIDREADEIEKEDPKELDTETGSVQLTTPTLSRNNPETEI